MNPIVVSKVAGGLKTFFTNRTVLIVIAVLVIIIILKKGVKKTVRKVRENKFDKNEFEDPNLLAQQYRSASNPSGYGWMIDFDGTKEDELLNIAYQTKGQKDAVSDAYKNKYAEALTDRVRKELSTKDFDHWKNIIS